MTKKKTKLNHVTLRLEPELTEKIDMLASYEDIDKSALYRQVVKKGIKEISREVAIKQYAEGEIGISRAAHMADMYIGDFMELLGARGIVNNITSEQQEEAKKNAHEFFQRVLASKSKEQKNNQSETNDLDYSINPIPKEPILCEPKRKKIGYKVSSQKKKRK